MVTTRRMAASAGNTGERKHLAVSKQQKNILNGTKSHSESMGWSAYMKRIQGLALEGWEIVTDPSRCSWWPITILLLLAEVVLNVVIIEKNKYTEIDWKAYMQEVSSTTILDPTNGTTDYSVIKGDTGPLVYPAGFVWIYSALYTLTNEGLEIKKAQFMFAAMYLLTLILAFRPLIRSKKLPAYALAMMCLTSYRVHSIYVLRLFNDPVAMLLLYAAVNAFCDGWWTIGSVFYSLAVSVKMNTLLFAPALLLAYVATQGIFGTALQLSVCALIQLILAYPFISTYPIQYFKGAFDIGRVFLFKWTVNWRFLPEEVFIHKGFHAVLLIAQLVVLIVMAKMWWKMLISYNENGRTELLLLPLYSSNFVGMVFARSLHYQFYIWYYHQLHFLVSCTRIPVKMRLLILGLIELCWNTYPSTSVSSGLLTMLHLMILTALNVFPNTVITKDKSDARIVEKTD